MRVPPGKAELNLAGVAREEQVGRYEPDRASAAELRAVLAISRALAGKLDRQRVLAAALREVAKIVGAEGASILLIDPDTGSMSFHLASGPGAEAAKTVPLPAGAGICGHVARTGAAVIVNDAQHDQRLYRRVDQATGLVTRNLLCVPLKGGQRPLGVLELMNKHGGTDFVGHDLRLAEAVGGQIALALENAELHRQILRRERMAAIGQTVSGLAHCIKNILNGIRSGSAVVSRVLDAPGEAEGPGAAPSVEHFQRLRQGWQVVRQNNDMLGNLVLDMLSLARESKYHPFPTDVNDLAEQVCRLMAQRAGERGIGLDFQPAPGLDDIVTDPTQLYRCLLNLVTNAVDACAEGGRVRVRVCRADRRPRVTISIADDGEGIAPENRARLFQDFFTTKGSRGTGLGLPVTRKLITQMGGKVAFHSVVGEGTKFVIALPAGNSPNPEKETAS